jgi:ketosteroid isomerase-like protein
MKTNYVTVMLIFFFSGIATHITAQMTVQEQETVKKEIREVAGIIFRNLEKMDAEALFQSYSNSIDFMFITTDGSMAGLQEAKNHHAAWFQSLSSLKVTTTKDYFRFLPGNIVIYSWLGKFEMTLGSGQQLKNDKFAITFIFSKTNNEWKVIHQHSSALPPT